MDEIHSPFRHRVNPHVDQARTHLNAWVLQTDLVRGDKARLRFERADFGWFAAMVYPTADRQRLELMADWFAWLFLVDDQLDDGDIGRSLATVSQVVNEMRTVLDRPTPTARAAAGRDRAPAISSLADLWRRTATDAPAAWRRRFVGHLEDCLSTAAVWEAGNRVRGIVPDEATYIENRRHTGAIYVCMDLIDIVERLDVPENVYHSAEFTAALDAACNVVCWTNDVYSLDKERSLGEVHNLAYLVEYHRGLDRRGALAEVRRAISAETRTFLAAQAELLRAWPGHHDQLTPCLAGMRTWMRGNLDWSRRTNRYRSPGEDTAARPAEYIDPALLRNGQ